MESKLVGFQLTTCKSFLEVKFNLNWYVVYTFFSWFFRFFNFLSCWVVVVDYLSRSIFDIYSARNISFHCCWDVELVVTSEGEFSCVDHLSVFCIAKWLSKAIFKSCSNHTVVNSDIEFSCNIITCYWIVSFDLSSVKIQLSFIVVIWDSYWLDVVLVSCVKLSSIQPYLVNQFSATFNCLSIQVFHIIIDGIVRIWVHIGIRVLICQLFVIIKKLVACDIVFLFRNNVFLWLELRFFRWSYSIIELFIWSVSNSCYNCLSSTIMGYLHCNCCNHIVVSYCCISTCNFWNSISVGLAKIIFTKLKFLKGNLTFCIILNSFNCNIVFLKNKAKFTSS